MNRHEAIRTRLTHNDVNKIDDSQGHSPGEDNFLMHFPSDYLSSSGCVSVGIFNTRCDFFPQWIFFPVHIFSVAIASRDLFW